MTSIVTALGQAGLSPKVKVPTVALVAVGVALVILGLALGSDQLVQAGIVVLGAGGVTLGGGWVAKPGDVVVPGPQVLQASPGFTITQAPAGTNIVVPQPSGGTISATSADPPPSA